MLITGSTGMVGRNAAEMLIKKGFEILTPTRSELDLMDKHPKMKYMFLPYDTNHPQVVNFVYNHFH